MRTNYEVSGSGTEWKVELHGTSGVLQTIEAASEKQAHFLAQQEWPDAMTPHEHQKMLDNDYYSREGYAYRAKMQRTE